MENRDFSYTIYIASTLGKVWEAFTSPEALRKNWGKIESAWTVGAAVTEVDDSGKVLWKGSVLRSEPPRLLSYTFDVTGSGEPPTEVTLELGPQESKVQLTITQTGFQDGSKLWVGCARAWPEILSSFKTYLETGRSLDFAWKH